MITWTMEQLNKMDDMDFAVAVLQERKNGLSNPYSPLAEKLIQTICTLKNAKETMSIKFYMAEKDIAVDVVVSREMYDGDPDSGSYTTHHPNKIKRFVCFAAKGNLVLDHNVDTNEHSGIGDPIGHSAWLEKGWKEKAREIALSEYLL